MKSRALPTKKKMFGGKNWAAELLKRVDKKYLPELLDIFVEYPEILTEVKKLV